MADRPTISVDTTSAQFRLNGRTVTALASRFCCGRRISSAQKTKSFGDRIFGAFKRPYSFRREILKRLATSKHVRFKAILKGDEESIPQTCDIRH
jgi:hypothetical protein